MSDVALSPLTRTSLLALQSLAETRVETTRRLSTGLRVSSVNDDPAAFFQAQSLTNRVGDLLSVKDGIGQGVSTVEGALAGLDALEDTARLLRGVAQSALGGTAEQRAAVAGQFDTLRQQLDALAADVSFQGVNLVAGSPNDLIVPLGDGGTTTTVTGTASDTAGLGIGAAASFNNFATNADINAAVLQIDGAIDALRGTASSFASSLALLEVRDDFTQGLIDGLETGAANLINVDLNAEAATALALSVREQLGVAGLAIAQEGPALISDLL